MRALRQIGGIALQTLRAGRRSRGFPVLLALLVATALVLPHSLRGDGSAAGSFELAVRYTLGGVLFVLTLVCAASGSGAVSVDRKKRILSLTLVKPVGAPVLFLGKWLGIVLLNAVLLALAYVLVLVPLCWRNAPDGTPLKSRMVCRTVIGAELADAKELARPVFEELKKQGKLPQHLTEQQAFREEVRRIENAYDVAHAGESITWTFHAPAQGGAQRMGLRLTLDQQWGQIGEVVGTVSVRPGHVKEWADEIPVTAALRNEIEVAFPRCEPGTGGTLHVRFTNVSTSNSGPVLIHPRRGVALLLYGRSFIGNALRAYAVQTAVLAAFAAVGVMLGSALSFPVASFAVVVLYFLVVISPALAEEEIYLDDGEQPGFFLRSGHFITVALRDSFTPLLAPEPLARLTAGDQLRGRDVCRALAAGGLLFPFLSLLLMHGVMKVRVSQEDE